MFKLANFGLDIQLFCAPEGTDDGGQTPTPESKDDGSKQEAKFTQADLDKAVQDRLARERAKHSNPAEANGEPKTPNNNADAKLDDSDKAAVQLILKKDALKTATDSIKKEFGEEVFNAIDDKIIKGIEDKFNSGEKNSDVYKAAMRSTITTEMLTGTPEFKAIAAKRIMGADALKAIMAGKTEGTDEAAEAAKKLAGQATPGNISGGQTPTGNANPEKKVAKSAKELKAMMMARLTSAK